MVDINLIKIKGMIKLFKKGKIEKLYTAMYNVAEGLAIHETGIYESRLMSIEKVKSRKDMFEHFDKVFEKREERLKYHMDEMKRLLLLSLKDKENKE